MSLFKIIIWPEALFNFVELRAVNAKKKKKLTSNFYSMGMPSQ